MISSHICGNPELVRAYHNGELELELIPQGTLSEKIRNGGAGIPAFYTSTGLGTLQEKGGFIMKYALGGGMVELLSSPTSRKEIKGKPYLYEESFFGDYSLVKAQKADRMGNLYFNKSARNFNQDMATASKVVIAEVKKFNNF
jgi:3-oxoacid CoA-transferase